MCINKCLILKIPEVHHHIVIQFYASIIKCTAMPNLSHVLTALQQLLLMTQY